jgi:hypothetical protein
MMLNVFVQVVAGLMMFEYPLCKRLLAWWCLNVFDGNHTTDVCFVCVALTNWLGLPFDGSGGVQQPFNPLYNLLGPKMNFQNSGSSCQERAID